MKTEHQPQIFIQNNFDRQKPFSNFLPGIAGCMGQPLWVFYCNRGQAITSFGAEDKDHPMLEFQPANKAWQQTSKTGFRTFIKIHNPNKSFIIEPFSDLTNKPRSMKISMDHLQIDETDSESKITTRVTYFLLPNETFSGLVRKLEITNTSADEMHLEVLDGAPVVIPYGVSDDLLKEMSRTLEAWMGVNNHENRIPMFKVPASPDDSDEVAIVEKGFYALAFLEQEVALLPVIIDPEIIFNFNTSFSTAEAFETESLDELLSKDQINCGKSPCCFFATKIHLAPGQSTTCYSVYGLANDHKALDEIATLVTKPGFIQKKQSESVTLILSLTEATNTLTASSQFDAYCRQTWLDNIMRGGIPIMLGDEESPKPYHVFSRKHGDPERDYNAFFLASEAYSQGNGNYRDVNQNRRNDVFFFPQVGDFNLRLFLSLIQPDGYNPLVVKGIQFSLPETALAEILALANNHPALKTLLQKNFSPGKLIQIIQQNKIPLEMTIEAFLNQVIAKSEINIEAEHGEGFWVDHWIYNLDLIDTYLEIFPEKETALFFADRNLRWFDNATVVKPRHQKYEIKHKKVRQYDATERIKSKKALIDQRANNKHWVHDELGMGNVYHSTVFEKCLILAMVKYSSIDPYGIGIEMEAGKPGWYDALNGLPGLFGSSTCELHELHRFLSILEAVSGRHKDQMVNLPIEADALLTDLYTATTCWQNTAHNTHDFDFWDQISTAREKYREAVCFGFDGKETKKSCTEIQPIIQTFRNKVEAGLGKATQLYQGKTPTYMTYDVDEYDEIIVEQRNADTNDKTSTCIKPKSFNVHFLPEFLEGYVHAFKSTQTKAQAEALFAQVKQSALFDQKLGMYRVNASLSTESHEIGRARAFPPGWLENQSIWLHMAYKYILEGLKAGLYEQFFADFRHVLVPFMDAQVYGRNPIENCSFIVSSAHVDEKQHGAGYVARLSGATAEFLSIWKLMFIGKNIFSIQNGKLTFTPQPAIPAWMFTETNTVQVNLFGDCRLTYHNPSRVNTWQENAQIIRIVLTLNDNKVTIEGNSLSSPYAEKLRDGEISSIDCFFANVA